MEEAIGAAAGATEMVAVVETVATSSLACPTRPGLTLHILPGPLDRHPLLAVSLASLVHGPSGTIAISLAATTRT